MPTARRCFAPTATVQGGIYDEIDVVTKVRHRRRSNRTDDRRGQCGGRPGRYAHRHRHRASGRHSASGSAGHRHRHELVRDDGTRRKIHHSARAGRHGRSPLDSRRLSGAEKIRSHRRRPDGDARFRDEHVGRAAAGSRDDGHRRTAPRRSRQRGRELSVSKLTETAPVRTIADVLARARARRHGAAGHADRRRPAHSRARHQQLQPVERADLRHRRHSHEQQQRLDGVRQRRQRTSAASATSARKTSRTSRS